MSLAPGTTLTCSSLLSAEEEAGFAAGLVAAAAGAAFAPGITAGFTAGAAAPGAGLAAGESDAGCCCSDFTALRALSMASGFFAAGVPGFAPAPAAEGVKS